MNKQFDIRDTQLRGYLREFYVKPDLSPAVWSAAKRCLEDTKNYIFGIKFMDDLSMKQFCQAVLLSSGKQLNWLCYKSYFVLQENLAGTILLTEYSDYDVLFIVHDRGTMKNAIMGATVNQVGILRSPKKTIFLDRGGPPLGDLSFPVVSLSDLSRSSVGSVVRDEVI